MRGTKKSEERQIEDLRSRLHCIFVLAGEVLFGDQLGNGEYTGLVRGLLRAGCVFAPEEWSKKVGRWCF